MDYGRPVQFGCFIIPDAAQPQRASGLASRADSLGFDLVGVQDHPYQRRFYDAWTLLSAIVVRTKRIAVFPDVTNLPLRPPAMLAKAAASLDLISGGRVELGLGAGAAWDAIKAMGGPDGHSPEDLATLVVEQGFETLVVGEGELVRLADEVIPKVRKLVAAARETR